MRKEDVLPCLAAGCLLSLMSFGVMWAFNLIYPLPQPFHGTMVTAFPLIGVFSLMWDRRTPASVKRSMGTTVATSLGALVFVLFAQVFLVPFYYPALAVGIALSSMGALPLHRAIKAVEGAREPSKTEPPLGV